MPRENEAGVSLEDARNAAESLFGDTLGAPKAELGKEQEAYTEADQSQQDSDLDGEEQAGGAETTPPEDLKLVVSIREGRASVGVQRPASDPYIESFDDRDVSELAQEIPAVLERARATWEGTPRYPAYARPAPQTRRRPRRNQGSAQASTEEGEAVQQDTQTLRLF